MWRCARHALAAFEWRLWSPPPPLPSHPSYPQLVCKSLSYLVGYRKKQRVYWCACIILEVLRVAYGPQNMLVSSGSCLHEWKRLLLFWWWWWRRPYPAQHRWMERPFTGHSLPACRVNGTVMRGSSADTWVSVNMLTAITVPNGLTSSLLPAFFCLSPFLALLRSLSISLTPAILLWHCVAVKTFNRRWMRNPCVKREGGRTHREKKRPERARPALPLSLCTRPRRTKGTSLFVFE